MDKLTRERTSEHFTQHIAAHIESILLLLGADEESNLGPTHWRVARSLWALTHGHRSDPFKHAQSCEVAPGRGLFESPFSQNPGPNLPPIEAVAAGVVAVRRIAFTSLCEHHMLPFFGHVYICYSPRGVVLGLSKLVRLVRGLSKMLQMQERFTVDIAETVVSLTDAKGVYVEVIAKHTCMMARGVEAPGDECDTVTSCCRGIFGESWECLSHVRSLLRG
eukprot:Protomagalhaensia_wolfi_Nauph_80__1256@NODE_1741_length_1368_cov_16_440181_g1354_i0_p1_GENE_NODE_1741_length_1368_cov_16_440181_g1354_i0NODE_1741_length_1368_cov_16_440181_g1354_i0_p1_ORF_typecomplete_len220_score3_85GTP_cyclohydroI/PF01227_22/9_4e43QueF/PF14489_6/0_011_NODE_1741_length_1368_cov_16_440181_g1354_i05101169